jgi:hypothetical protein
MQYGNCTTHYSALSKMLCVWRALIAGSCGQRRLVARLLPRFLHAFPPQLDTAAATLIDLHEQPCPTSEQVQRQVEEATRHDALLGLGCVLLAARGGAGQPGAAAVRRVLEYLLR